VQNPTKYQQILSNRKLDFQTGCFDLIKKADGNYMQLMGEIYSVQEYKAVNY
jgi:hypothetical protein